jgi:S1-C subfamily serine protease
MTSIDWVIVAFALVLAFHGWTRGFIVGFMSLLGFALGAMIGTRLGPMLLSSGDRSQYAPIFGLAGALLAGAVMAGGLEGVAVRARSGLGLPFLRTVDGVLGAILTGALALALAWLVGAIVLQVAGSRGLRSDVERSAILGELDRILPPSGPLLNALAQFDPLPSVAGPPADVAAPRSGVLANAAIRADATSVVRVVGQACGLGIEGSGWVVGPGLVVTNAHVVAGEAGDTYVEASGNSPSLTATVVAFDAHDDIALLRVRGLEAPPLRIASSARSGTEAAILGYPLNGPFNAQPARLGRTQLTSTDNAYGEGPVLRVISSLRGLVRPGNSGGPLVDSDGSVIGTLFASMTDSPVGEPSGFAVPNSVLRPLLSQTGTSTAQVSSGHCAP